MTTEEQNKDPFLAGYKAHEDGRKKWQNPFPLSDQHYPHHIAWSEGWDDAKMHKDNQ